MHAYTNIRVFLSTIALGALPLGCDVEEPASDAGLSQWSCVVLCSVDGDEHEAHYATRAATADEAAEEADAACEAIRSASRQLERAACVDLSADVEFRGLDLLDAPSLGGGDSAEPDEEGEGDADEPDKKGEEDATYCPSPLSICTAQTEKFMIQAACDNACVKAGGPLCTASGIVPGVQDNCPNPAHTNYVCLCA